MAASAPRSALPRSGGTTALGALRARAAAPDAPRFAQGGRERAEQPGVRAFLERLQSTQARCCAAFQRPRPRDIISQSRCRVPALTRAPPPQVPCAIGCSESAASVERGLVATGLKPYFEAGALRWRRSATLGAFVALRGALTRSAAVITGDDVQRGRPDPECYLYSAQAIGALSLCGCGAWFTEHGSHTFALARRPAARALHCDWQRQHVH